MNGIKNLAAKFAATAAAGSPRQSKTTAGQDLVWNQYAIADFLFTYISVL